MTIRPFGLPPSINKKKEELAKTGVQIKYQFAQPKTPPPPQHRAENQAKEVEVKERAIAAVSAL